MRQFVSILTVVCVLGASSALLADTINVDFNSNGGSAGTYSGVAAAPDTGTYWNTVTLPSGQPITSGALTASDGTTLTSVTVAFTNSVNGYDNGPCADGTPANALLSDYGYPWGTNSLDFSLDHLTPGGVYNLYLYNQSGGANVANATFTIGTVSKTVANAPYTTFVEGTNYAYFAGLVADVNGSIAGTVSGDPGANYVAFNGLQITSVPEPGTCVTLVVCCFSLLAYAWRKRK